MAPRSDAQRIQDLRALCDQLDTLQKQAAEICRAATLEIQRAENASQRERRSKTKKVKNDRRSASK